MANTVPVLNFTNTFGDLVSAQNRAAIELNNLGANTYTKDSGTLILNGAGTGLTVTNAGLLGSLVVLNTMSAGGSISTQASVFVNGSGSALEVANNSLLRGNVVTNNLTANNVIRTTTLNASGNVIANDVTANNLIRTNTLNAQGNVFVNNLQSNGAIFGASANIVGKIITNSFTSNTSIDGSTLVISNQSTTNDLQANNVVNTAIVVASNRVIGQNIQANTGLSANALFVSDIAFANVMQANSSIGTALISVTGPGIVNFLQSNTSVNTSSITVTDTIFTNALQATSFVNTPNVITNNAQVNNLSISGGTFANTIVANTTITTPTLVVTSRIDANSAPTSFFNNIQTTGQVSVGGNFVINGATVYSTNTFTLNAGSAVGQISSFAVNRGSSGANAAIRWNEPLGYWDIRDVNNPTSFSKVLTANLISNSIASTSSDTLASSLAANTLNNALQANVVSLQSQITSNVNSINSTIVGIQAVDNTQNTTIIALNNYAATGFARANTSSNTFIGTTGSANATGGITTFTSTNGVTIAGSANTLTINTPQDLRTSASPTFSSLTLTNPLAISQGGTSATSAAAALTNLLPTGTVAGYVLTTSGPGTYFWAPIGAQQTIPGTTISSTRLSYIANGSGISYTTPTYVPGASQLRVYFDGVRQFASSYTETSPTIVTFGTAVPAGVNILIEVDGYIDNPYYANNITFTAPFGGIVSSANTIQLAIQDLETRKAALTSASFSGAVTGITVDTNASNTSFATTAFVKNALNQSSNTFNTNISGNAGTVTNGVYTTGNQTIAGVKTFTSTIQGNANTASFATTPAITSNDTSIATTAFVRSIVPSGVILMWSGSIATIPNGWLLCNGLNGTPDLRDRFIVGAGSSYAVGDTGGAASITLSTSQLPSHTHTFSASVTTGGPSNGHSHTFSGTTSGQSVSHTHAVSDPGHRHVFGGDDMIGGSQGYDVASYFQYDAVSSYSGGGANYFTKNTALQNTPQTTGISLGNASSDHSHTYSGTTSDMSADHTHTVSVTGTTGSTGSGSSIENRPPYYALAYIMKS